LLLYRHLAFLQSLALIPLDLVPSSVTNYLTSYVEPYVAIFLVLGALLWAGIRLNGRAQFVTAKRAIAGEIRLNLKVCNAMIEYVEAQKVGHPYSIAMPRFYTTAFENLRIHGYLYRFKKKDLTQELIEIYTTIDRIHAASDRQEELAVGAAAAAPMAADLRSQNLAFILGNIKNVVEPRLGRLEAYYGKR